MTAKEKAKELVKKFYDTLPGWVNTDDAKQCALIAVDEIIFTVNMCIPYQNEETYIEFWKEVKTEIEAL